MTIRFVFILFLACLSLSQCAKILINGYVMRSHYLVMNAIAEELGSRGHQIIYPLPDCLTFTRDNPFIKHYRVEEEDEYLLCNSSEADDNLLSSITKAMNRSLTTCKYVFSSQVFKEIQDADIQVGEIFTPCSPITADYLDIPYVGVFTTILNFPIMDRWSPTGYSSLSYVPYGVNPSTGLNFFQRVKNLLNYLVMNIIMSDIVTDPLSDEFLLETNLLPGKKYKDVKSRASLVLVNTDFVFEEAQPVSPDVKVVGSILTKPASPLPKQFERRHFSTCDGVILVSFGTGGTEDEWTGLLQALASAFSRLPYKVLWKLKHPDKLTLGNNTVVFPWLPQNDILGHPKTKLLITHAGLNSIHEAIYHGVPMVSMPIFGDQPGNSQRMVSRDMSIEVDSTRNHEEVEKHMFYAATEVLNNPKYKNTILRMSKILKSRVRSPVQEAADWVEHVLHVKDMSYLQPLGNRMPLYQRYLLDVFVFLFILLAAFCFLLKVVTMFVYKCIKEHWVGQQVKVKSS